MSVVIVGGNERMVCQYEDICKGYGCKAKVFAKEKGAMKKKIGAPDLMILFTGTLFLFDDKNEMERMFFLVNGVLYVPGYLYLRRYYDELLPLW